MIDFTIDDVLITRTYTSIGRIPQQKITGYIAGFIPFSASITGTPKYAQRVYSVKDGKTIVDTCGELSGQIIPSRVEISGIYLADKCPEIIYENKKYILGTLKKMPKIESIEFKNINLHGIILTEWDEVNKCGKFLVDWWEERDIIRTNSIIKE